MFTEYTVHEEKKNNTMQKKTIYFAVYIMEFRRRNLNTN